MQLIWNGHACFSLECEDGILVIDPFEDGSVPGLKNLRLNAHQVLCSHEHFDHNARQTVTLINEKKSFQIKTLPTYHDDKQGALRGTNLIHIITTEGQSVVHMGDLGHIPTASQMDELKHCDVLMIPVGGHYTIDSPTAKTIIDAIEPRIVIPMHYSSDDFGFDVIAKIDTFTSLFKEVTYYPTNTITITPSTPQQIAILDYQ